MKKKHAFSQLWFMVYNCTKVYSAPGTAPKAISPTAISLAYSSVFNSCGVHCRMDNLRSSVFISKATGNPNFKQKQWNGLPSLI